MNGNPTKLTHRRRNKLVLAVHGLEDDEILGVCSLLDVPDVERTLYPDGE